MHAINKRVLYFCPTPTVYPQIARKLVGSPSFAATFRQASALVEASLGWSPWRTVQDGRPATAVTAFEANLVTEGLMQIALFQAHRDAGLAFDYVLGCSLGELSAAYACGVLTFEEVIGIHCGVVQAFRQSAPGDIVVTTAPPAAVRSILAGWDGELHTVIEGPAMNVWGVRAEQKAALQELITDAGYQIRFLGFPGVPHTELFDAAPVEQALGALVPRAPTVRYFSTVTGAEVLSVPGTGFWRRYVTRPALFASALAALEAEPFDEVMRFGSGRSEGDIAKVTVKGRSGAIREAAEELLPR